VDVFGRLKVTPIKKSVCYLDKNWNPVDDEEQAKWVITHRFGRNGTTTNCKIQVIIDDPKKVEPSLETEKDLGEV
jgi:hypothetical protein